MIQADTMFDFNSYLKKPVKVKAVRLTESMWHIVHSQINQVVSISNRQLAASESAGQKVFLVDTLEGVMTGNIGDMLIIGVKGEIYPCKQDIFEQTYMEAISNGQIRHRNSFTQKACHGHRPIAGKRVTAPIRAS